MPSSDQTIRIRKFQPGAVITVTVIETREFKIRKWVSLGLIKLACWVLGCGLEVKNG